MRTYIEVGLLIAIWVLLYQRGELADNLARSEAEAAQLRKEVEVAKETYQRLQAISEASEKNKEKAIKLIRRGQDGKAIAILNKSFN